ncbi:MAG: cytochrome c [Gammaproteobacteria bacterium]|jgi:cytochrome c553|nr:cytochrome c [Gammaproteobacteria bacterium]MCP4879386.1 cytochrome c [Gammaproteobacteria bacterium]MDP6165760.1 cytochrome c [Gammaproteobacteria bacterium]
MSKILRVAALACLPLFTLPAQAAGDAAAGAAKAAACIGCHGVDGNSVVPMFPKLAGQHAAYLETSMKAYQSQERKGGNAVQMYGMVAALSDQDIADLAAFFSSK